MSTELDKLNQVLTDTAEIFTALAQANETRKYNNQVLELSKDQQKWSQDFNERQFQESKNQFLQNYGFNLGQAQLSQSNFENATQIRASDMAKAGLNPLNLVGGAEGSNANFMNGSNIGGSASSGSASPLNQINIAQLLAQRSSQIHESRENAKAIKSAEHIASIQAQSAKDVAQISADASKYGSDLNYTAQSDRNDVERVSAILNKEIKEAELTERKYEFDTDLEKSVNEFNANIKNSTFLEMIRQKGENARTVATLNVSNFKTILSEYNNAIRNHADFAIAVANLRARAQELEFAKDKEQKELAFKYYKSALDASTQQMSNITNLAGDICKGFLVGNLSGRR